MAHFGEWSCEVLLFWSASELSLYSHLKCVGDRSTTKKSARDEWKMNKKRNTDQNKGFLCVCCVVSVRLERLAETQHGNVVDAPCHPNLFVVSPSIASIKRVLVLGGDGDVCREGGGLFGVAALMSPRREAGDVCGSRIRIEYRLPFAKPRKVHFTQV